MEEGILKNHTQSRKGYSEWEMDDGSWIMEEREYCIKSWIAVFKENPEQGNPYR
jgi:hypothetical protein